MSHKVYWMVHCPSHGMPTKVHETLDSAEREAARLAVCCPNERFYVLEAVNSCVKRDVEWNRVPDSDLPF